MLPFTPLRTAAILITVLVTCAFAIPNFVSDETLTGWPDWAQRRIMLAPELQGGTSALLVIDRDDERGQVLASWFDDVRGALREARVYLASPIAMRSGSVEVRPKSSDFERALAKLRELSQAFNGVREVDMTNAGNGLILLTPTEAGASEYEASALNYGTDAIRRNLSFLGLSPTVEHEGADRLRVRAPGCYRGLVNCTARF